MNTSSNLLNVIVLAAGKGTRMNSELPKVLHKIAGRSMLQHVLDTVKELNKNVKPTVVVGHGRDKIIQTFTDYACQWVEQAEQLGTGHALLQALPQLEDEGISLILYGDVPLIGVETLQALTSDIDDKSLGLLTVKLDNPTGYGRIIRNSNGDVTAIVEQKDASEAELAITEINTGIMAVANKHLKRWLPQLSADNKQGEYYLTDIIAMAYADNVTIKTCQPLSPEEVEGINSRSQQARLERIYQQNCVQILMDQGVSFADPARFDCRGKLETGRDIYIDINVIIEGQVTIEDGCSIGPNCVIKNSHIGKNSQIKANSLLEDAYIHRDCEVGPYARLRPGTHLKEGAKIGNFVEVKKSIIGAGSKVNHLSYIGDCHMGAGVNIGAGTITCNYDGVNKVQTLIGDNCFVGSNSALVAPVELARGTTVGAGSIINHNTEEDDLAVSRARQKNIKGWSRPVKK
ncbi:MAG TPA: bifunctional UDP-N-acetylglucosamine diphosphorylase/glucosamine-1-phosphate N-acetyltransferase GlmU [Cellvibrionaceae bacterium]